MLVEDLILYQVDYWMHNCLKRATLILIHCAGGFWEAVMEEYQAAEPPTGFQGMVDD